MKDKNDKRINAPDGISSWYEAHSRGINCWASGEYCSSYEDKAPKLDIPDRTDEYMKEDKKSALPLERQDTDEDSVQTETLTTAKVTKRA